MSALALAYPITAVVWYGRTTPDSNPMHAVGYGLAQLAYVLVVAGLVGRGFAVLRLRKRWPTLLLAAPIFLVGTVLVNLQVDWHGVAGAVVLIALVWGGLWVIGGLLRDSRPAEPTGEPDRERL